MDSELVAQLLDPRPLEGIRAGSGLAWQEKRLIAVQDDALSAGRVDPKTGKTELIIFETDGQNRLGEEDRPDFEAALSGPNGEIYILGSGATSSRQIIARLDFVNGEVALIHAMRFYDVIAKALARPPNIEGAVLVGDVLRLFHRGSATRTDPSTSIDMPASCIDGTGARVLCTTTFDLGSINGVPFAFTDATRLGDDAILYTAVAAEGHAVDREGKPISVAIGVIRNDEARWTLLWEQSGQNSGRGVEGIILDDPSAREGWLITDPVRAEASSELCRLKLTGDW